MTPYLLPTRRLGYVHDAARSLKAWCIGRQQKSDESGNKIIQSYGALVQNRPLAKVPYCLRLAALVEVDMRPKLRKNMFAEAASIISTKQLGSGFTGAS